MSEQYSPKSFDDGDSDYRQFKDMQYRDELLGGAEQGSARYEEAKAYDERLKAMDGRSKEDAYDEAMQQPDAVERAIAAGNPQVRFMKALAEQIAVLRNKAVDADRADRDVQSLKDKEDSFNERLAEYENNEDADPSIINRLMEIATAEKTAADTSDTTSGETGEQTTDKDQTTAPEADVNYKDLTDEQKAAVITDVAGMIDSIDQSYATNDGPARLAQLTKLRDSLTRDGGMTTDEASQVVQAAHDQMFGDEAPRLFETVSDSDKALTIDSDSDRTPSDEVLEELQMTPEERKRRDLISLYRNASSDEMRRISEAAWGADSMHDYDEAQAYAVTDDEAARYMQRAFDNGYQPAGAASPEGEQSAQAEPRRQSLDDLERTTTPDTDQSAGFFNRLRSRWDNMENRRKKVTRAIAGVALTAIGITGAVVAYKLHIDHTAVLDAANALKPGAKAATEHAVNDPQAGANLVDHLKNLHVGAGQGIYDVLAHNGIDKSKVSYTELYDLQRQFPKELYLQQVGNVTDVRITNPGNLSQSLADALAKLARN